MVKWLLLLQLRGGILHFPGGKQTKNKMKTKKKIKKTQHIKCFFFNLPLLDFQLHEVVLTIWEPEGNVPEIRSEKTSLNLNLKEILWCSVNNNLPLALAIVYLHLLLCLCSHATHCSNLKKLHSLYKSFAALKIPSKTLRYTMWERLLLLLLNSPSVPPIFLADGRWVGIILYKSLNSVFFTLQPSIFIPATLLWASKQAFSLLNSLRGSMFCGSCNCCLTSSKVLCTRLNFSWKQELDPSIYWVCGQAFQRCGLST